MGTGTERTVDSWAALKAAGYEPCCFKDNVDPKRELNLAGNLPFETAMAEAARSKRAYHNADIVIADREYETHDPQQFSGCKLAAIWELFPW